MKTEILKSMDDITNKTIEVNNAVAELNKTFDGTEVRHLSTILEVEIFL
jgi:hypothetical protein